MLGSPRTCWLYSDYVLTLIIRFTPVLRIGLFLWSVGAGLRLLFKRDTCIFVYTVVLAIEGAGVGFTHQPGKNGTK